MTEEPGQRRQINTTNVVGNQSVFYHSLLFHVYKSSVNRPEVLASSASHDATMLWV